MKRWLIMVLVLVGALALATTGVTVAQENHKHGSTQQTSSSPSSKDAPKHELGTTSEPSEAMKSAIQSAQGGAEPTASSSGPVYGPFVRSYFDTNNKLFNGFPGLAYGYVYPTQGDTNYFFVDYFYYDSSTGKLTDNLADHTPLFTDDSGTAQYYSDAPISRNFTQTETGTWVAVGNNCYNASNPSGGGPNGSCVEGFDAFTVQ